MIDSSSTIILYDFYGWLHCICMMHLFYCDFTIALVLRDAYPAQDWKGIRLDLVGLTEIMLTSSYNPIFSTPRSLKPNQSTAAVMPLPQLVMMGRPPLMIDSACSEPTALTSAL